MIINTLGVSVVCAVALLLISCGGSNGSHGDDRDNNKRQNNFNYYPPTTADIAQAKAIVVNRDLSPKNVQVVYQGEYNDQHLISILEHTVESITHYGAIVYPKNPASLPMPVMVMTDGQGNRSIDIEPWLNRSWNSQFQNAIVVIPAFRSRTLMFRGMSWFGTGSMCDEFDGAATDAISLVNAAQQIMPDGDFNHYLVRGNSRGGNTALLMSERDSRVAVVIASGAPVDFYRYSMWTDSPDMYECQFLQNKTETESRMRMLNSSPVFFANDAQGVIDIHQGSLDLITHPWNAQIMYDALRSAGKEVNVYYYEKGHGDIWSAPLIIDRITQRVDEFLENY